MGILKLISMNGRSWVKAVLTLGLLSVFFYGSASFAAADTSCLGSPGTNSLGAVANTVASSLPAVFKLIVAIMIVAGITLILMGFFGIKAHAANPQQHTLSKPIVHIIVGIGLLFIPNIVQVGGQTLFGVSTPTAPKVDVCGILGSSG